MTNQTILQYLLAKDLFSGNLATVKTFDGTLESGIYLSSFQKKGDSLFLTCRDEEQQGGIALDMPQKIMPQAFSFGGPFDDAGDVCHYEAAEVPVLYNLQVGFQGGKLVIGNFGFGRGKGRQQGRFSRIGEPHKAHICQYLELEGNVLFLSGGARLGIAGGLVGGGFEMPVSTSAHPAAREDFLLPILGDFKEDFPRFGVSGHRPQRHLQDNVLPVCTRAALLAPMFAMSGMEMTFELETQKGPEVFVPPGDNMPPTASVPPVRAALRHKLFAAQVRRPLPPVPGTEVNFDVIDEITFSHVLWFRLWPGQAALVESVFRQLVLAEMRKLDPDYADWMVTVTYRVSGT